MKNGMLAVLGVLGLALIQTGRAQMANADGPPARGGGAPLLVFSPEENPVAKRMVSERFQIVRDLGGIDPQVLALFYTKVPALKIANAGETFQATDVVVDRPVPVRRLLFAGKTPGVWFILYEHGGRGYRHQLAVFTRAAGSPWRLAAWPSGFDEKLDFEGLQAALRAGRFAERPGYVYY